MNKIDKKFLEACEEGDLKLMKECLEKGADINVRTKDNKLGIDLAVDSKHMELAKFLEMEHIKKSDLKAKVKKLFMAILKEDVKGIEKALKDGVNIESLNQFKNTALSLSCEYNLFEVAKLLIKKGANVNASNEGFTPLMWAASLGYLKLLKLLLKNAADPNAKCKNSNPVYVYSCKSNDPEIFKELVKAGANTDPENDKYPAFIFDPCSELLTSLEFKRLLSLRKVYNLKTESFENKLNIDIKRKYKTFKDCEFCKKLKLNKESFEGDELKNEPYVFYERFGYSEYGLPRKVIIRCPYCYTYYSYEQHSYKEPGTWDDEYSLALIKRLSTKEALKELEETKKTEDELSVDFIDRYVRDKNWRNIKKLIEKNDEDIFFVVSDCLRECEDIRLLSRLALPISNCLSSENKKIREDAFIFFERAKKNFEIISGFDQIRSILIDSLKTEKNKYNRWNAIDILVNYYMKKKEWDEILKLLNNKELRLQSRVMNELSDLALYGGDLSPLFSVFVELFYSKNKEVRSYAYKVFSFSVMRGVDISPVLDDLKKKIRTRGVVATLAGYYVNVENYKELELLIKKYPKKHAGIKWMLENIQRLRDIDLLRFINLI